MEKRKEKYFLFLFSNRLLILLQQSKHGTSHSIWFTNTNRTYTYLRLCLFAEARDMLTSSSMAKKTPSIAKVFLRSRFSLMMLCKSYQKNCLLWKTISFLCAAVLFPRKQNCSSRAELLLILPGLCSTLLSQCCYPCVTLCCVLVGFSIRSWGQAPR